jgi:methyltransferase (TIGR00027 family)
MEPDKRSVMAEGTALFRAAHQVIDDDPKVLPDPLALAILGVKAEAIEADRDRHAKPYLKQARTLTVMRSRYTEDELAAAIDRGVTQYVVLGAGLDTSPYRSQTAFHNLKTFEIDHPATQRWKLDCLKQSGIQTPENLTHVAIDFERESLADGLERNAFDPDQPTFFSWLGVMYYLQRESALTTFRYIAQLPTNSQVVLDFMLDYASLDPTKRESVRQASEYVASIGEPWLTRYSAAALEDVLRDLGFNEVTYFSNALATERYLKDRSDGLSLDPLIQMMSATT